MAKVGKPASHPAMLKLQEFGFTQKEFTEWSTYSVPSIKRLYETNRERFDVVVYGAMAQRIRHIAKGL